MVRILLITLFSTVSVFSGEFLDLKIEGSYSVLKRENASPFLTNEHIVAMGLGNIWKLRPSRKDEKDRATVELFIKTIARHAYAERSPLTFNMFEALWDSTQDAALKEHFGCIHGIILTSHLLKSTIHHNDDDSRILSKLKNRFNDKARQKFLEWSYNNLEKSEKQKKKFTYERIKELLAAKELSREQFLVFMNENCCAAELNEKPMQAISRLSITGVMENIEGAFRDKKYPYGEIRGVLGQVYALDNPHEILGIEDRIVHFICNMNDEALKTEMVEEILTRAVEYDCPALRAALINNCCLDVEAIEECKATTLGTAARTGNIKVVRELLGLHTDVNRMYGF